MEKRRLNGGRCSWPPSADFVKDCKTRKRKKNNIDELIFINGIRPFLLCALIYEGNSISKLQIQVATYIF
jgi:hypothetical protein